MGRTLKWLIGLAAVLGLAGCEWHVQPQLEPRAAPFLGTTQTQASVALIISATVRSARYSGVVAHPNGNTLSADFEIGKPLESLTWQALSQIFSDVEIAETAPKAEVDFVFEPRFVSVHPGFQQPGMMTQYATAEFTMGLSVTRHGRVIFDQVFKSPTARGGEGSGAEPFGESLGKAVSDAMSSAVTEAVTTFLRSPPARQALAELRRPAQTAGTTSSGVAPAPEMLDLVYWQSVKDSTDTRDLEAYLHDYPNGQFAGLARNRLAALKPQLEPISLPAPAPNTNPPPVDGKRVALVIGNAQYRAISPLDNTVTDARLIAATLQKLGFELVGNGALLNLDRAGFVKAVATFGDRLADSGVGVFYYAGHGLQMQGANFLVPVDANPNKPADADIQLVDAGMILRQMEDSGAKLKVVILDACRNNPFGGRGLRDSTGGLAQMRAPQGTLISYATQPGNVAQDGPSGGDSPYTTALSRALQKPGTEVLRMFNDVGVMVDAATHHVQQPWLAISPINGEFYFSGR